MGHVSGTEWEMPVMLAGMYGLRMGEILGLRWRNVDMEKGTFAVIEQLPFRVPVETTIVEQMAAVKGKGTDNSGERVLPITEATQPYFKRQFELQERQRELVVSGGGTYYENDIVVARANGAPDKRDRVSWGFKQMLKRSGFPRIRFHDLRHTAATNMHQLTGDFFTVGIILGHSLKGAGIQLGISTKLDAVTAQYVDVRLERKQEVLEAYHNAVYPRELLDAYHDALHPKNDKANKAKPPKGKGHGMEL
jgi:integrase